MEKQRNLSSITLIEYSESVNLEMDINPMAS